MSTVVAHASFGNQMIIFLQSCGLLRGDPKVLKNFGIAPSPGWGIMPVSRPNQIPKFNNSCAPKRYLQATYPTGATAGLPRLGLVEALALSRTFGASLRKHLLDPAGLMRNTPEVNQEQSLGGSLTTSFFWSDDGGAGSLRLLFKGNVVFMLRNGRIPYLKCLHA